MDAPLGPAWATPPAAALRAGRRQLLRRSGVSLTALAGGAVLTGALGAACSLGQARPLHGGGLLGQPKLRPEVTLLLLGSQAQQQAQLVAEIVAGFAQVSGGTSATYSNVADTNAYYDKLQALLAAGTAPDMAWIDVRQFPGYAARGLLRQLDAYIARDKYDVSDFFEKATAQYRWNGSKLYGLSWDFGFRQLFYNVARFAQAGVPLPPNDWKAPGWTFADFLDAARRLTESAGPGQISQFGFANTTDWMAFVYANGGRITNEDSTESWLDRPEASEAFGFLADLMLKHQVAQTPDDMKQRDALTTFMQGKAAMSIHPTAVGTAQFRTMTDFTWDVTPMPRGPSLSGDRRTHGGGSGWMLPAPGNNPEEAWALFRHVTGKPAGEQLARRGVAPPRQSIAHSLAWLDPSVPPKSKQVFVDGGNYIMPQPKLLTWDEFLAAVNKELAKLWAGQANAAATAAALKQVAAPIIQKHKDLLAELQKP